MPSETMDMKRFSSSSLFSDDRQVGFWKPDATADHFGCERPVASYPLEKFIPKEGQIMKSSEHSEPQPMQDQKVKVGVVRNAVGAERAVNRSSIMSKSLDNDTVQPMPYFAENNKINLMGSQYENNLFSNSFSDLFSQNMRLTLNNTYGQSVDNVASHCEEEEPLESIEEIEAQTIGDLLPDDDDLLSGVTEGLQHIVQPNGGDDLDEMDLFSSIGGMDLGDDNSSTRQRNSEFPRGYSQGMLNFDTRSNPNFNPESLPEYQGGLANCSSSSTLAANINPRPVGRIDNKQLGRVSSNGQVVEQNEGVFGSPGNVSGPLTGHHYPWSNSFHHHPPGLMWSNSPPASFVNGGVYTTHPQQRLHGLPKAPPHILKPVFLDHHVGSAPAVNHWNRRPLYSGQSPEASGFHPGSLGNMRIPNNSLHSMELGSRNFYPHSIGNGMDMPVPPRNVGLQSHHQSCMMFPGRTQMIPMMNSFDSHSERVRSRRNEGGPNQGDSKKQYELDIERIKRGEDNRTTLMIKNIPNKYTSKMLLAAIDEHHRGTYDFLYLPIDFKNKCNVGYAFINMTDPLHIIPYYQAFNGKKWEKFNSEKVASIAYARIQGKAALVSHFQNSSLMNEDKRCRPILFNTDGPNPGDQVPFPMGVNIRTKPGKTRTTTREENHDCSNGDSSSASGRESD